MSAEVPDDLAAVQADDTQLAELATARMADDDTEETFRLLAAWRREVHIDSDLPLIDTERAAAAIAAGRSRPRREPLRYVIAAFAVLVIACTTVGLASLPAQPGDWLYPLRVVLYGKRVP